MLNDLESQQSLFGTGTPQYESKQSSLWADPTSQALPQVNLNQTLSRLSKVMKPQLERGLNTGSNSFELKSLVLNQRLREEMSPNK